MSSGLIAAIWIGVPLLAATLAIGLTRLPAAPIACSLPVAAVIAGFIQLEFFVAPTASNSTAPIIIPGSFVFAVLGTLPGVSVGLAVRDFFNRRKQNHG